MSISKFDTRVESYSYGVHVIRNAFCQKEYRSVCEMLTSGNYIPFENGSQKVDQLVGKKRSEY